MGDRTDLVADAVTPNTQKVYRKAFSEFEQWLIQRAHVCFRLIGCWKNILMISSRGLPPGVRGRNVRLQGRQWYGDIRRGGISYLDQIER